MKGLGLGSRLWQVYSSSWWSRWPRNGGRGRTGMIHTGTDCTVVVDLDTGSWSCNGENENVNVKKWKCKCKMNLNANAKNANDRRVHRRHYKATESNGLLSLGRSTKIQINLMWPWALAWYFWPHKSKLLLRNMVGTSVSIRRP